MYACLSIIRLVKDNACVFVMKKLTCSFLTINEFLPFKHNYRNRSFSLSPKDAKKSFNLEIVSHPYMLRQSTILVTSSIFMMNRPFVMHMNGYKISTLNNFLHV